MYQQDGIDHQNVYLLKVIMIIKWMSGEWAVFSLRYLVYFHCFLVKMNWTKFIKYMMYWEHHINRCWQGLKGIKILILNLIFLIGEELESDI